MEIHQDAYTGVWEIKSEITGEILGEGLTYWQALSLMDELEPPEPECDPYFTEIEIVAAILAEEEDVQSSL